MPLMKRSETCLDRSSDPLWWALAALLSLGSVWLPTLLRMPDRMPDRITPIVVTYLAMFFSGGLLGGLRPDRVWRWGVAAFLTFGINGLAGYATNPKFNWSMADQIWAYLASNSGAWAIATLPMLAGAYVGFYLARGNIK
jgi:hypothetical protein